MRYDPTRMLDGQVAIITGAGAGIGRECALTYARHGAAVMVNALHEDTTAAVVEDLRKEGGRAEPIPGDVSEPEFMVDALARTLEAFGRIDLLHNNAAYPSGASLVKTSVELWRKVFAVTLDSVFFGMHAVLPTMIEQRSGCIINTTSAQAILAVEGFSAYGSAKASVITISRVAALENAKHGIRVNALCPGSVHSRSWDEYEDTLDIDDYVAQIPQRRVGEPEELADAALFLASPMASYVNGTVLIVDGGMSARTSLPRSRPPQPKSV